MFDRRLLENFDWILFFLVCLLSIMGIVAIYSAASSYGVETTFYKKQIAWFIIGLIVMVAMTMVDYRIIGRVSLIFHLVVIGLLVLVLIYGTGGPGSPVKRWLHLGPFYLQPSEFAKFSLVLYLAHYFRDPRRIGDITFKELLWPLTVTAVPFLLILKQPDLGTAGLLVLIFIPVIYLVGIRYQVVAAFGVLGLISMPFAWFYVLKPYQQERILTLLNPERDPLGKGYHIIQSKIAVGSGGLWGKGFLQGTQAQLNFLPARHTDFIFSVFCEEWGFVGGTFLLSVYFFFIFWSLRFIGKTKDRSGSILTMGIVAIFTSHIIINAGMVLGVLPVVGMPLPFFSYGGSAMISMMIGVGLILNVRMRRFDIK